MPYYVAPIVGYGCSHPITGGPRLYCVLCAEVVGVTGVPVHGDSPPHNTEPCDLCGKPLTTDPTITVLVP